MNEPLVLATLAALDMGYGTVVGLLRSLFWVALGLVGALCAVEWGVRTNRMNAFSPLARAAHSILRPVLRPVERAIVGAGGTSASVPWWTLVAVFVVGIVALWLLESTQDALSSVVYALQSGPTGVLRLLFDWTFSALYLALLIRVLASWVGWNPYRGIVRIAFALTEPILAPLRGVLPTLGMIDFSPLVAYFILRLLQGLVMRVL